MCTLCRGVSMHVWVQVELEFRRWCSPRSGVRGSCEPPSVGAGKKLNKTKHFLYSQKNWLISWAEWYVPVFPVGGRNRRISSSKPTHVVKCCCKTKNPEECFPDTIIEFILTFKKFFLNWMCKGFYADTW